MFVGEADLVVHHIKKLRNGGVSDKDIAVIAPYSLQVLRVHCVCTTSMCLCVRFAIKRIFFFSNSTTIYVDIQTCTIARGLCLQLFGIIDICTYTVADLGGVLGVPEPLFPLDQAS